MRDENDSNGADIGAAENIASREGWQNYVELRKMLRALGDEVRLNIVHVLAATGASGDSAREVNVTDLAELLAVSQPLISWHLGALRRTGLVRTTRIGREVYCALDLTRYRFCLRLLGKVLEPGTQGEGADRASAAAPDTSGGIAGVPGLLPRRSRARRPKAMPAQPAPGTSDPW
ncbi:MAG: metalloregulator ArsR/SmtB family transcription factor [Ktedonobacterales bacterium]